MLVSYDEAISIFVELRLLQGHQNVGELRLNLTEIVSQSNIAGSPECW